MDERKRLRLEGYDYSRGGYYFVTVCTQNRACLFWGPGRAGPGPAPTPPLNEYGRLVTETWVDLPNHIAGVELDKFVVMPNHIHGIIRLTGICPVSSSPAHPATPVACVGAGPRPAHPADAAHSPVSLTEVVRQFKSFSARRVNAARGTTGFSLWQRSYYDHVIRNEPDYLRIWNYIDANPLQWAEDEYYIAQES